MKYHIRSIIFGLSIFGAAWMLQDIHVTFDHVVVMDTVDTKSADESADQDASNTATQI